MGGSSNRAKALKMGDGETGPARVADKASGGASLRELGQGTAERVRQHRSLTDQ
jgi:hypothetical protein